MDPPWSEIEGMQMSPFTILRILLSGIFFAGSLCAKEAVPRLETLGKRIFENECSSKAERLVWWNEGEDFASLGIGHFIWYPEGIKGPFEETFPKLLAFFRDRGIALPQWLTCIPACPWRTREECFAPAGTPKRKELQELLTRTLPLQAMFIELRFEAAIPKILSGLSAEKKAHVQKQIALLQRTPEGKFALIDYLHFKGDGTVATERYRGKGWGLQQVLLQMEDTPDDPLVVFTKAAKFLLEQRVKGAPAESHEEKWLPGWLARIDRYRKSSIPPNK